MLTIVPPKDRIVKVWTKPRRNQFVKFCLFTLVGYLTCYFLTKEAFPNFELSFISFVILFTPLFIGALATCYYQLTEKPKEIEKTEIEDPGVIH